MNKHIIYLAAGNSRRFGSNKLLHITQGKPLYQHGLDMLMEFCRKHTDCTLLVVSQYEEILHQAEKCGIRAVYSPLSVKGMSYTIRAALQALGDIPEEDFLIFAVADQPCLSEHTMGKLIECASSGVETASVAYGDRPGNPAMFSVGLIPELLSLQGDEGGRKIIRRHACTYIQVQDERELMDIDTPDY